MKQEYNYYWKGTTDFVPVRVTIIQRQKGKVEIIRNSNIKNRTNYAGFWVNYSELTLEINYICKLPKSLKNCKIPLTITNNKIFHESRRRITK